MINETDDYEDLKALGLIHIIFESAINLRFKKCDYKFDYQSKELVYESIEMVVHFFERIKGLFRLYKLNNDLFALYITAYTTFNVSGKNSWLRSKVCETLKTSLSQVELSDAGTIIDIISGDSDALSKIDSNTVVVFKSHPEYNYKMKGNNMLKHIVKFENIETAKQVREKLIEIYGGVSISIAYCNHEKENIAQGLFEIKGLEIDTILLMIYAVHDYKFNIMDANYCDVKEFDIVDNDEQYLSNIVHHRLKNIYGSDAGFIVDSTESIISKVFENLLNISETVLEKRLINAKCSNLLKVLIVILELAVYTKKYKTEARFDAVKYDAECLTPLCENDVNKLNHFIRDLKKLLKSYNLDFELFLLNVSMKACYKNLPDHDYLMTILERNLEFEGLRAEKELADSQLLSDIVSGEIDKTSAYKMSYDFNIYTFFNSYVGEGIHQESVEKQSFTDDLELTPYEIASAEKIADEIINNGLEAIPQECDSYGRVETEYEKRVRELEEVLTKSKHDVYMEFRKHPLYNYLMNKINLMNAHGLLNSEIKLDDNGFKFLCDYLHIEIPLLAVSTSFEKLTNRNINWTYEFNNMMCPINYIMNQAKDEMVHKLEFYNSTKFDLLDEVIILEDDYYSDFNMNYYKYLGKIIDYAISMKKNIDNIISSMCYALMIIENIDIGHCSLDYLDDQARIAQEKKITKRR